MSLIGRILKKNAENENLQLCDLHCHLLPYVDDGATDMEEACAMLKSEYAQGVRTIVITTHLRTGFFDTPADKVQKHYLQLQEWARQDGLFDLKILQSREYYCDERLWTLLRGYTDGVREVVYEGVSFDPQKEILPFGIRKCILLEFSDRREQKNEMKQFVRAVSAAGLTPVLAHVERYPAVQQEYNLLNELRQMGAMVQINAEAVMGREGRLQRELTHALIREQLADLVASDAHHAEKRKPDLQECYRYINRKFNAVCGKQLLYAGPYHLIHE